LKNQPSNVALVGFGLAGAKFHAPLIAATPGLRLAAVVTSDAERGRRSRELYPGIEVVGDAAELWRRAVDLGLDLAVLATPNRTHASLTEAALGAGLAVVVDKPFTPTAAAARRLIAAAAAAGRFVTVFQNRRWDGDFLTIRRLIESGELGEVHRFESRFERWRPVIKPGWRQRPDPEEAGGLLYDLGAHLIDQAMVLFGGVHEVDAELRQRRPGSEVDDDTFVALRHASGVISHLWMSDVAARPGPRFRVLGSRAGYVKHGLDGQEEALRSGRTPDEPGWGEEPEERWGTVGAGDEVRKVETVPGDYPAFYAAVAAALAGEAPVPVEPEDAARVLEVIERAMG
jgi:predicted dehydrogenase